MVTIGSTLAGYRIEGVAGRGGMGVVYRARQLRPDRLVALKVLATELLDDPEFRERFERESSIAASIEHPHVIPVYEVDEADGVLFIAMRYVEGSDLRSLIRRGLSPVGSARIVDQVARALDAAHARGLVHRDVKPANVLVSQADDEPHAYLTDFGLTKHLGMSQGPTRTGALVGTIDYIAPEQIRGRGRRRPRRRLLARLPSVRVPHRPGAVPARGRRGEAVGAPQPSASIALGGGDPNATALGRR